MSAEDSQPTLSVVVMEYISQVSESVCLQVMRQYLRQSLNAIAFFYSGTDPNQGVSPQKHDYVWISLFISKNGGGSGGGRKKNSIFGVCLLVLAMCPNFLNDQFIAIALFGMEFKSHKFSCYGKIHGLVFST